MATITARDELTNFLATKLQPADAMEFNGWLAARPALSAWLAVPLHRRTAILESEAETAARTTLNEKGRVL